MRLTLLACVGAFLSLGLVAAEEQFEAEGAGHINLVLLGATGSLAKKYLWQAMFNAAVSAEPHRPVHVYGAGRHPADTAAEGMKAIVAEHVACDALDQPLENCEARKAEFVDSVQYRQLKTDEDFKELHKELHTEDGELFRIFYLSVPPFAYVALARQINKFCRPDSSGTLLRVAIEKPFGSDHGSAHAMVADLETELRPDELYRVDHYLGKRGVQQIQVFREHNHELFSQFWNYEQVERVEIVMKETEDCAGRTGFYNEYGVVRDVVQNHLTEILALVALGPKRYDYEDLAQLKANVIAAAQPAHYHDALFGQYEKYEQHLKEDHKESNQDVSAAHIPTFVAARIRIETPEWQRVPFYFVAGKALNERKAYARIVFKHSSGLFCGIGTKHCRGREVLFSIQGHQYGAATVITGDLPFEVPEGWNSTSPEEGVTVLTPDHTVGSDLPYNHLVRALINGDNSDFVSTHGLMSSWNLWGGLLHVPEHSMKHYGEDGKGLAFNLEPLSFVDDVQGESETYGRDYRDL